MASESQKESEVEFEILNPDLPEAELEFLRVLIAAIGRVPQGERGNAGIFQDAVEREFRRDDLRVSREVAAPDGSGRTGRIDLVVSGDPPWAIELDWRTPRAGSLAKLLGFKGRRMVVLREADAPPNTAGLDVIVWCQGPPVSASPSLAERAGAFVQWYQDTHERLIGVGYIGNPHKDYQSALQLVAKFSDQDVRDAALFWFGQDDDFAINGTRTITKFASRASDCLLHARRVVRTKAFA